MGTRDLTRDEFRRQVAAQAFDLVETEIRPFLAAGGRLWTKGSRGYPTQLRRLLERLEVDCPVAYTTEDAMLLPERMRVVEHVLPMKRIVVEIVDPRQVDPRSNQDARSLAGGPAMSPEHLIAVFDRLLVKCWVTKHEHDRLNRAGRSAQWDAPNGDGWLRYELAGVAVRPV